MTDVLQYTFDRALGSQRGVERDDLIALEPRLNAARQEVFDDLSLMEPDGGTTASEKIPLDAGFIRLPENMLAEVPRLQQVADDLSGRVDRVVVLGIGGSYMGARALMEARCHAFWNELDRAGRGDRPRLYFDGNNVDNLAVAQLLDLLRSDRQPWGIVVISKSGGTLETAVALRIFAEALGEQVGSEWGSFIVPVTKPRQPSADDDSGLRQLARSLGIDDAQMFDVPDGVGGRYSVLSAVGLLPAAILGLDVEALLRGAIAMTERVQQAPLGQNPVLDYVGICHLHEQRGATIRVLETWGKQLEAVGLWYDQLLSESLGKHERGATPITAVNTRDLHSRAQQHLQGRRDKLHTNLYVARSDPPVVRVPHSDRDEDNLNRFHDRPLDDLLTAARRGTDEALDDDHRPTAEIRLSRLDEFALGQLLQMLMLATAVEGRLIGINPYGQPGVQAYKKNMERILEE